MKRHHHWLSTLARLGSSTLVSLPALLYLTACGSDPAKHSELDGVRDNRYVRFEVVSFLNEGEEYSKVPGPVLYHMVMTEPKSGEARSYPIDCWGKELAAVTAAFGVDAGSPRPRTESLENLEFLQKISEQPIFNCSNVNPKEEKSRPIDKVFQLVDDRSEDIKLKEPLPQLYVRFNNVTETDATNQEQFYSIGCRNILDTFGTAGQKSLVDAVPLLASSAVSIFPGFMSYRPLNCLTFNTQDPLLGSSPKKVTDFPLKTTYDVAQRQLNFYRVVDAFTPGRTISYLLGQGNDHKRILCYGVSADEIKLALNFPSNYVIQDLKSDDALYLDSLQQPELECVDSDLGKRFDNRWSTVRQVPAVNYFKKRDSNTLYRFGCPSAEKYFTAGFTPESPLQVTSDLVQYLAQTRAGGYQVVTFPCYGSGLTVDPKVLTAGEVVSLKGLAAPTGKIWLDGNTANAAIAQQPTKNTGSFWLVSSTGEDASFTLQTLGRTPGVTYLACPITGNTPKLVKTANDANHITKWTVFRGDGASTSSARLGCRDASGRIRLLTGGGAALTLSDEIKGQDPSTNWVFERHTFVEDPNFLAPGKIVSFISLTQSDKPWLAAYPGKTPEVGLEKLATSPATYFQVEKRTDNRGVSLKSLNKGPGDLYLDCKPEVPSFQLAPATNGGWIGTGYKAYKLTNTTFLIHKLACFDPTMKIPYFAAMSGNAPTIRVGMKPGFSDMNSIHYLEVRTAGPKF